MALAAIIKQEVFDGLNEDIQKEYKKQDDGTYILDVTPVDDFALENVKGLKSTISSTRRERDEAVAKLKKYDGLDAESAKEAIKKLEELGDLENLPTDEKVKQQIESIKQQYADKEAQLVKKYKQELQESEARLSERDKIIVSKDRDSVIRDALAKHKGAQFLADTIEKMVKVEVKDGKTSVSVLDKDGNARISPAAGSTEPMTIEELVVEMKTSDTYAGAFEGTGASGSGAGGAGGAGGGKGSGTVSVNDQKAIEANIDDIASGKVKVVE